jgi:Pyridoxamine 5'-phosphate oxidase
VTGRLVPPWARDPGSRQVRWSRRGGTSAAAPDPARHGEPGIPGTHRDFLDRPLTVALSTRMPDGSAQTQPVWCSLDGNDVLVNTTWQRRKGRNPGADPRATILALDPPTAAGGLRSAVT